MPLFVRKISLAKWPNELIPRSDYPADSISDLRTSQNRLSFWVIDSINHLQIAIIALATAPLNNKLEKMQLLWIDESDLKKEGFAIKQSDGETAAVVYKETHRDIDNLTYHSLGVMAEIIVHAIHKENYRIIKTPDVKEFVRQAYIKGDIDLNRCNPGIAEVLRGYGDTKN